MEIFCETFKVDDNLIFDEIHKIFKYTHESHTEILPAENIISCTVTTDLSSLDKNLFHEKPMPGYGNIPFVNDLKELSKAVWENDIFLTISFYDQAKNLIHYKKRFPPRSKEAYALMAKINK